MSDFFRGYGQIQSTGWTVFWRDLNYNYSKCYVRVPGLRDSISYLIGRFPCRSSLTLSPF
ncbi:unnamed protein product [Brassica oleracea]